MKTKNPKPTATTTENKTLFESSPKTKSKMRQSTKKVAARRMAATLETVSKYGCVCATYVSDLVGIGALLGLGGTCSSAKVPHSRTAKLASHQQKLNLNSYKTETVRKVINL